MARSLALEVFDREILGGREFNVANVARMLLEDLSGPSALLSRPEDDDEPAGPPPPPPVDTTSHDYAAGHEAGRQEALEEGAAALAEMQERVEKAEAALAAFEPQLAGALAAMAMERAANQRRLAEDGAAIVGAALEALLPHLAQRGFAAEAADCLRDWLSRAASAEGVLTVSPETVDQMRAIVGRSEAAASVRVESTSDLGASAARFEWRDGLGEIDLQDAAQRILAGFNAHLERLDLAGAVAAKALTPPTLDDPAPSAAVEEAAAEDAAAEETAAADATPKPRSRARKAAAPKAAAAEAAETAAETAAKPARKSRAKKASPEASEADAEKTAKPAARRRSNGAAKTKSAEADSADAPSTVRNTGASDE